MTESQETLKKFLIALPAADCVIVSLEARTAFLRNPNVWEAAYRLPQQNDQAEEEEVVLNNKQVSAGNDTPQAEEVETEDREVHSNDPSPRPSFASSKTTKLKGKFY